LETKDKLTVVAIGGGAAGFFGAIACAQTNPTATVTILEAGRQPLTKVRISGGGRCNVTHACFDPAVLIGHYPRGGKALRGPFSRFQPQDTIAWFEERGVSLKTEEDGRIFPTTDDSATIVNCLRQTADRLGVTLKTGTVVVRVTRLDSGRFEIGLKSGDCLECDRLLLATGSHPLGYAIARSLGHQVVPPVPSLFTFNIGDARLQDLAGISVPVARLKLPEAKLEQVGPILITHWGLSGPAVLKLSAWGARFLHDRRYQASLSVNWIGDLSTEKTRERLYQLKSDFPRRAIGTHSPFTLPRRLWERLVATTPIDPQKRWAQVSKKELNHLAVELTQGSYLIGGKGVFKEEFVTCGGIPLPEIQFKTMESRVCPGLFFAGEILDIDGVTGGFNFQNAWTTSWLAGRAIARHGL